MTSSNTARVHEFLSLQKRGVVSLPAVVRERLHLDEPGAQLEIRETPDGRFEIRGVLPVPADQQWFWTDRWQRMERQADDDVASGRVVATATVDDFLAELHDDGA